MLMLMLMTHYGVWNIWIRRNCWHFACTRHITGDAVRTPCTRPHSDTRSSQDFDPSCQKVWNRTTRRKKVKIYHITGFSQGDWLTTADLCTQFIEEFSENGVIKYMVQLVRDDNLALSRCVNMRVGVTPVWGKRQGVWNMFSWLESGEYDWSYTVNSKISHVVSSIRICSMVIFYAILSVTRAAT